LVLVALEKGKEGPFAGWNHLRWTGQGSLVLVGVELGWIWVGI